MDVKSPPQVPEPAGAPAAPISTVVLLHALRLPARLTAAQTAAILGFQPHDIPILCAAELLTPLGEPAPRAPKYFAAVGVRARAADVAWLDEATVAVAKHWAKNRAESARRAARTARKNLQPVSKQV